jgi:hypothetical protein
VFLGQCYEEGKGVTQDFVEAHKWYNLAAAQAAPSNFPGIHKFTYQLRDALGAKMTPEQIAEAQRRASSKLRGGPAYIRWRATCTIGVAQTGSERLVLCIFVGYANLMQINGSRQSFKRLSSSFATEEVIHTWTGADEP